MVLTRCFGSRAWPTQRALDQGGFVRRLCMSSGKRASMSLGVWQSEWRLSADNCLLVGRFGG